MSLNFEISERRATQHPFVKSVQASLCLSLSLPDVSFPYSFFLPPPFFPPLLALLPTHSPPADDFLSSRFNRPPSADCAVSLGPVIDIGYAVCELIAAWRGLIGRSPAKRRVGSPLIGSPRESNSALEEEKERGRLPRYKYGGPCIIRGTPAANWSNFAPRNAIVYRWPACTKRDWRVSSPLKRPFFAPTRIVIIVERRTRACSRTKRRRGGRIRRRRRRRRRDVFFRGVLARGFTIQPRNPFLDERRWDKYGGEWGRFYAR